MAGRAPSVNIVIGGEAGQGLVTVGSLLAKALVRCGYSLVVTQGYQSRIRGGHNTFSLRVSAEPVSAPRESVDILVALDPQTVVLHREELSPQALVVSGVAESAASGAQVRIPFSEIASKRSENIVALGVLSELLGLDRDATASVVEGAFGKKGPQVVTDNVAALDAAVGWTKAQHLSGLPLAKPSEGRGRLLLNGNDAIALGAMAAGVAFYAFYPMTPATSIGLALATHATEMSIVVLQAEDEIAAITMALGASYAGAPAMVGTSGGGFALMAEGVSLAGMIETPLVVVVGQRPGPATGLPTRTEQADLECVLHAGHGEFPRAIFAPGSVEECFHLTCQAFVLAERFQGPVFLLTDQFLADSDRAVEPFALDGMSPPPVSLREHRGDTSYRRFAITESGVSPRLVPGSSDCCVVVDSDEHTEDGHLTEDLAVRRRMVEKRLRKLEGLRSEAVPPTIVGPDAPDLLFVCWGSTRGAVEEAAEELAAHGRRVATMHFSQVWPLAPAQFLQRLETAREVIAVEGNATGQFAKLVRRETGVAVSRCILRYDGLPITPEYILRSMER